MQRSTRASSWGRQLGSTLVATVSLAIWMAWGGISLAPVVGQETAPEDKSSANSPAPSRQLSAAEEAELQETRAMGAEVARLYRAEKYAEAVALATRQLEIRQRLLKPDDPDTVASLNNLAELHRRLGHYAQAETLFQQALSSSEKAFGPEHSNTVTCMNNLAVVHRTRGNLPAAEPLLLRAMAISEKINGPEAPQTAICLKSLGSLYESLGKYTLAETSYTRALKIRKQVLGLEDTDTAISMNDLAVLYKTLGRYQSAESLARDAVAIHERVLGPNHTETAISRQNLAMLYRSMGNATQAEVLAVSALASFEKSLGPDHPQTAACRRNLALIRLTLGDYAQAEAQLVQARATVEKTLGLEHPLRATVLSTQADAAELQGNYAQAEALYRRALAIREKVLGPDHIDTAASVESLASLYEHLGNYAQAEPLQLRAVAIREETFGADHVETAESLSNLVSLYIALHRYQQAQLLAERALAIRQHELGTDHPDTASSLNSLAVIQELTGHLDRAESLYRQALEIDQRILGPDHESTAATSQNLAVVLARQSRLAEAVPLLQRAWKINEKSWGPRHSQTLIALENLGEVYLVMGQKAEAESCLRGALTATEANLEEAAWGQSERQQLAMARSERTVLHSYLQLALSSPEYVPAAYGFLLRWKGSVSTRQRLQRAVATDTQLAPKFLALQRVVSRLSALALASPAPEEQQAWQQQIKDYSDAKERLEQELSSGSATFLAARHRATSAEVQEALSPETALLDFIEFTVLSPPDAQRGKPQMNEWHLAVFVVGRQGPPRLLDLGPTRAIDAAIGTWRDGKFGATAQAQTAGQTLREQIWQPLEAYLSGVSTVLISPDGGLAALPLMALPGKKPGTYLLEDYALAIVPVPSDLATPPSKGSSAESPAGLLALGDVDYEQQSIQPHDLPDSGQPPTLAAASTAPNRAPIDSKTLHFSKLSGTALEMIAVEGAYRTAYPQEWPARLSGSQASEASLRALAPRHRFLHLATHGFFADPSVRSALAREVMSRDGFGMHGFSSDQRLVGYHPNLLSGIALAGANQPLLDGDDGIMTAAEVQTLDLRGVELVTLSACESGLGQTADGEGLLGLQRAFQIAGARSVVGSLWKVDDAATVVLMTEFYRNLWTQKLSPLQALRRAQLKMLAGYVPTNGTWRAGGFAEQQVDEQRLIAASAQLRNSPQPGQSLCPPYYWAGFFLSGNGH